MVLSIPHHTEVYTKEFLLPLMFSLKLYDVLSDFFARDLLQLQN